MSGHQLLTPFHSDYLAPSATAFSKMSNMVQMFSLINILNCLPPLIFVLKHICTRLTILTSSKNNHKIKVVETFSGQLAVGMHPLDCKYTILSFPKMLITLTTCIGRGDRGEGGVLKRRVQE